MAKGDYPTGALVAVIREYKDLGGNIEIYEAAKQELKNLIFSLVRLEMDKQGVPDLCICLRPHSDYPICETDFHA